MTDNENVLTVDMDKARVDVRDAIANMLTAQIHTLTGAVMDAVIDNADEPSGVTLAVARRAAAENQWTSSDLQVDVDYDELDVDEVVYNMSTEALVRAAVEYDGASTVADALTDLMTADEFITWLFSVNGAEGELSWLGRMSAENKEKLVRALGVTTSIPVTEAPPVPVPVFFDIDAVRRALEVEVRAKVMAEVVGFMAQKQA